MVAATYKSDRSEDASTNLLEDPYSVLDDEAGDTLSLCDLPIYSDDSISDDYRKQDRSSSFDSADGFFEFFSDDSSLNSNFTFSETDNIIFCGKLIPCKQPSASQGTGKIKSAKSSAANCMFRAKSRSFSNGKLSAVDAEDREYASARSRGVKNSNSSSIPVKSRCLLFLIGSARLPKEMELSDMRTRQRRSSRLAMLRPAEKEMMKSSGGKRRHGLWKLLGALVMGWRRDGKNGAVRGSFI